MRRSPHFCYVISDITPTLKRVLKTIDATPTPDNQGYYGFHKTYAAYYEVVDYNKLLGDAKKREPHLLRQAQRAAGRTPSRRSRAVRANPLKPVSMKYPSGIDDNRLPGHRLGAAHGATMSAQSSLSAAFFSSEPAASARFSGRRFAVARVPSSRPGRDAVDSVSGANATAMQRVRWIRPAFDTA